MAKLADKAQGLATRFHSSLYRKTEGRFGGQMFGAPVLLLNTVGRKSGKPRTTPLLYLADGDDYAIVASNGGAPKHPAWWLNLRERPEATVEVGGRKARVRAEEAGPEEKARLWPKLVEMYPSYADYQKKTKREIPVVVLHRAP
jgi:F420H(2)-dependent quinone reductase